MRKWKSCILLLLAACVIAACAAMPEIVSIWLDQQNLGRTHRAQVANIQLDIREAADASPLAGIAMMGRLDGSLEISQSMASMSRTEAEARFDQIVQQYVDAGLAERFDPIVYECRCLLASVTADPAMNRIYWMITLISGDDQNFAQFDIAIDDGTGDVLSIHYATDRASDPAEREKQLAAFSRLYFDSLGIPDYQAFVTNDLRKLAENQNYCAVRYRFGDLVYGEVNVDLYVNAHGFYTEFPDLGGKQP